MEDSFFGFDTSVPLDDDGGGQIAEPSEEEYDALNDETFGSAINGDWEEVHENLVRLTGDDDGDGDTLDSGAHAVSSGAYGSLSGMKNSRSQRLADSDLELNLSGMKLDDVDLNYGDNESMSGLLGDTVKMDPSVWSLGVKDRTLGGTPSNAPIGNRMSSNPEEFLREHFPTPFQHHQQQQNQVQSNQQQLQMKQQQLQSQNQSFGLPHYPNMPSLQSQQQQQQQPKICTLEDIERNMIMQQSIPKQPQVHHHQQNQQQQQEADMIAKQQKILHDILRHSSETPTPLQQQSQHLQQGHHQQQQMLSQQYSLLRLAQKGQQGPRSFVNPNQQSPPRPSNNFANNLAQHPLGNLLQQDQPQAQPLHPQPQLGAPGNRLPPGFYFQQSGHPQLPPHPLLNQHGGMPNNFPNQRPLPNAHLPVALNNFAMHPNFNAMRARGIHPAAILAQQHQQQQQSAANRIPGHLPNPMMLLNQNPNTSNSSFNMFNMRLVQEIQQNHPLLQNAARQAQQHQQQNALVQNHGNINNNHNLRTGGPNAALAGTGIVGNQKQNHNLRRDGVSANGNLPHEEFDEYANLMSTREKHWLIGIQLSQLNTDTPYIDDYYYTVYKERKVALSGNLRHSQAHKDNQLNHPLTQPKGHAQLILVQLGNKNGQRNGQHRERRNSENHNQNQEVKLPTYVFTPLKFENSLGKLQYGSVTAPRKIIDAEIMSNETNSATAGPTNIIAKDGTSVQSGTLAAIGTTQSISSVIGVKSETPAMVQMSNTVGDMTTANSQRKSRYILLHIETLYRILLKLEDLNSPNVIATILMKKKKESERIAALEQMENANKTPEERASDSSNNPSMKSKFNYEIETKEALIDKLVAGLQHDKVVAMMNVRKGKVLIRRIMSNIENHDVRWNVWIGVFSSLQNVIKKDRDDTEGVLYSLYPEFNKQIKSANFEIIVKISSAITINDKKFNGVFCSKFGISSLVCLILQAENIYVANDDATLTENNKDSWRQFLDQVALSLNRTIQNQTICAAIESDSIQPIMNHFARFKDLKLDSLLALITEAKQQIN
ncbi:hypothetical protein FF38_01974 [Lucilia cuprina]|uniref:mRNA decay factor PAT1 domain-containing protein n=1 Tax=Lucilia cuprina TaxID=7375 RepID=A0A0L0CRB3_LUCCU|nr:Protein PAT1 like protein 1 [Lucilia cuprina]KNC34781.1 hypothetical protein FF38_01974 [Lucilia cuprina]